MNPERARTLPADTAFYGAAFQAVAYAEGAGFTVESNKKGSTARRPDMPASEFRLLANGPRFFWQHRRINYEEFPK